MIRYTQQIVPGEAVYAMVVRDQGHGYAVKVKFADRDNGDGLLWPPELFAEYLPTREAATALAAERGFTVVSSWQKARRAYAARNQQNA